LNKYIAASFVVLALFILIAILVSPKGYFNFNNNNNKSHILEADSSAFLYVNNFHSKTFDKLMVLLTKYGREVFWPIAIILLFVLGRWTGKKTAVIIAISMLVLLPLGVIAKDVVARPRPTIPKSDFLIAADSEYAFPSGHALIVSAGASISLLLFRNTIKRLAVSLALTSEAALVCISRVYVGSHYPLDVIGGILLGVGISLILVGSERHIDSVMIRIRKRIIKN
jgi:membrane-associated phospholipid phosphatase